nr:MAG TPA: hypothetical protein [Inoviridae sp.]
MFFLEKENGKNQDSVFLVILGKQGNTEIYYLGKAILRENTILLYIENTHEFGKKEADEYARKNNNPLIVRVVVDSKTERICF